MLNASLSPQTAAAAQRSQDLAQALAAMRDPAQEIRPPVDPVMDRLAEALLQRKYGQSMQGFAQAAHADPRQIAWLAQSGLDRPSGGQLGGFAAAAMPGPTQNFAGVQAGPEIGLNSKLHPEDAAPYGAYATTGDPGMFASGPMFEDLVPNQSAPWRPSPGGGGADDFGQTVGSMIAADAVQQSRPTPDADGTLPDGSGGRWTPNGPQVTFTLVPTVQLTTNPYGDLTNGLSTDLPPVTINGASNGQVNGSAETVTAAQGAGGAPSSQTIAWPLGGGGALGVAGVAGVIPLTIASDSLITKATDGSTYSRDGDPVVGQLTTIGKTIVTDRIPQGAYATSAGAIANVAVDWAGHVYHQFYLPDGNGGYVAGNNTTIELPKSSTYTFFDISNEMISYTPYKDGTALNGHVNFTETYDNALQSGIRLIPSAQPNFDQLAQLENSPLGGALYGVSNLLGASPSQQQAWLNVGSIAEGFGAGSVSAPRGPLTTFGAGQPSGYPAAGEASQSTVWGLGPGDRGELLEQLYGQNLPQNMPSIDNFEEGMATSIKSVDLRAPSYQSASALNRALTGYVDAVSSYDGTGPKGWGGFVIRSGATLGRSLILIVPTGASAAQQRVIDQTVTYGTSKGGQVDVFVHLGERMKLASAAKINRKILIQGYSRAKSGVWIASGPVFVTGADDDVGALGSAIMDALNNSVEGVRHPDVAEWKAIQRPMLEAANVKTWADLAKKAKVVGIECDDHRVAMIPSADYKNNGGTNLWEHKVEVAIDLMELGSALRSSFEKCK